MRRGLPLSSFGDRETLNRRKERRARSVSHKQQPVSSPNPCRKKDLLDSLLLNESHELNELNVPESTRQCHPDFHANREHISLCEYRVKREKEKKRNDESPVLQTDI